MLLGLTAVGFLALAGLAAVVLGRGSDGRGPSRGLLLVTGGRCTGAWHGRLGGAGVAAAP